MFTSSNNACLASARRPVIARYGVKASPRHRKHEHCDTHEFPAKHRDADLALLDLDWAAARHLDGMRSPLRPLRGRSPAVAELDPVTVHVHRGDSGQRAEVRLHPWVMVAGPACFSGGFLRLNPDPLTRACEQVQIRPTANVEELVDKALEQLGTESSRPLFRNILFSLCFHIPWW